MRSMTVEVFKLTDFGTGCSSAFRKPATHAKTRREKEMTKGQNTKTSSL